MKRDPDLLRRILLIQESESRDEVAALRSKHSDPTIADHTLQLQESGLVEARIQRDRQNVPCEAVVTRLTSQGHDFLALSRHHKFWEAAKKKLQDAGLGLTVDLLKPVLLTMAKDHLHLG